MTKSKRSSVANRGSSRRRNGALTTRSQDSTAGRVRAKTSVSRVHEAVKPVSSQKQESPAPAQGFAVKIDGIKSAVPSAWMFGG